MPRLLKPRPLLSLISAWKPKASDPMCSVVCFAKWTIVYFPPGGGFPSLDQFRSQPTAQYCGDKLDPRPQYNKYGLKICPKEQSGAAEHRNILWHRGKVLVWNKQHYVAAHVAIRCIKLIMVSVSSPGARWQPVKLSFRIPLPNPRITIKLSSAPRAALWDGPRFIHHSV